VLLAIGETTQIRVEISVERNGQTRRLKVSRQYSSRDVLSATVRLALSTTRWPSSHCSRHHIEC